MSGFALCASLLCAPVLAGCGGKLQSQAADPNPSAQVQPQSPAEELKPVPPTPIAIKKTELDEPTWDPAWTETIEKSLPSSLLSSRRAKVVGPLCPRFRRLSKPERRAFWAYFFQALAGAEAGLKPTADVHHTDPEVDVTDTVTHRPVRQEGLLQLTYMDSSRYGCEFDWSKDRNLPEHHPAKTILQPENNLLCGVKILEDQIVKRHELLLSNSSYWSTLRPGNASFPVFEKQMANVPVYCEVQPQHPEPTENSPSPVADAASQLPKTEPSGSGIRPLSVIQAAGPSH